MKAGTDHGHEAKTKPCCKSSLFLSVKIQVWNSSANHTLHSFEPSPQRGNIRCNPDYPLRPLEQRTGCAQLPIRFTFVPAFPSISVSRKSIFLGSRDSTCKILIQRESGTLLNVSSWPGHQVKYCKL